MLGMTLEHSGFLGIAEMLGKLDLAGMKIVEYPTTLSVRVLGYSKMKVARTITGHFKLLASLVKQRLSGKALPAGEEAGRARREGLDISAIQKASRDRAQRVKEMSAELESIEEQRRNIAATAKAINYKPKN